MGRATCDGSMSRPCSEWRLPAAAAAALLAGLRGAELAPAPSQATALAPILVDCLCGGDRPQIAQRRVSESWLEVGMLAMAWRRRRVQFAGSDWTIYPIGSPDDARATLYPAPATFRIAASPAAAAPQGGDEGLRVGVHVLALLDPRVAALRCVLQKPLVVVDGAACLRPRRSEPRVHRGALFADPFQASFHRCCTLACGRAKRVDYLSFSVAFLCSSIIRGLKFGRQAICCT